MQSRSRAFERLLLALALVGIAPSCLLFFGNGEPAPTLDLAESPELLLGTSGTIVVAQGHDHLIVIPLPSGEQKEVPTAGSALAASAADEQGRVVYVRKHRPWFSLGFGDSEYTLVLKSLATGEERELGNVGSGDRDDGRAFQVSLAAGRALCSFRARRPHVFEVSNGVRLETAWWDRGIKALRLSGDGRRILGWASGDPADARARVGVFSVDLETRQALLLALGYPHAFDSEGQVLHSRDVWAPGTTSPDPETAPLPGCTAFPVSLVSERLAVYEGLASPSSMPRSHFSLRAPGFDRSIRLGDVELQKTLTLVPRYGFGSYAYSPFRMP